MVDPGRSQAETITGSEPKKVLLRRPVPCPPRHPLPIPEYSSNGPVPPSTPDDELVQLPAASPKTRGKSRSSLSTGMSIKQVPPPSQMTVNSPLKPQITKRRVLLDTQASDRATVASGSQYSHSLSAGTHVTMKMRGPDNFPLPAVRVLRVTQAFTEEPSPSERLYIENKQKPSEAVSRFVEAFARKENIPMSRVEKIVYSRQNFRQITKLVADMLNGPKQTEVNKKNVSEMIPEEDFPYPPSDIAVTGSRIPQRQLLIEMAHTLTSEMRSLTQNENIFATTKIEGKYNPHRPIDEQPALEFAFFENKPLGEENVKKSVCLDSRVLVQSSSETHFMDSKRTHSPFVDALGAIEPADMALFESLIQGGILLSLKAHFIDFIPDLTPLRMTLRYLNLSFNNFTTFPSEVCLLGNLEVLKMRNNPIAEIPENVTLLKNLKTFEISFCLLGELPPSVFTLRKLQYVDVSYNKLTVLPADIRKLKNLQVLFVEGNQLAALPSSILVLSNLRYIRVRNNFMHPIFWPDYAKNDNPQRLEDLACLTFMQLSLNKRYETLPNRAKDALSKCTKCDCCKGPMFGPGLTLIRPGGMFGVKNVPFMFHSCSHYCAQLFMTSSDSLSEILFEDDDDEFSI